MALPSDLIELGQSERPNSHEQICKAKSTLRKHLVFNRLEKCDNTTPVTKALEDFFPIHLSKEKKKKKEVTRSVFNMRIQDLDKRWYLSFVTNGFKDSCKSLIDYLCILPGLS